MLSLPQYGNSHLLVVQQCSKLPLIVRQDEAHTQTCTCKSKHMNTHTVYENVTEIHMCGCVCVCFHGLSKMLWGESDRGQRRIEPQHEEGYEFALLRP